MYGGGYTALGLAATSCHPVQAGVLEPLLRKLRPHGQTGLHWAALGAHVDAVQALLAAGAPVDTRDDSFSGTPIGWALHGWSGSGSPSGDARYCEVVRALRKAGATIDQGWNEDRPLAAALVQDPRMRAALGLDAWQRRCSPRGC